ncbi:mesenchyme-specific cell surface glycoprotein-like [Mizuhopecten yessoensis]|uniref:mesenchyme-specific cell surface glycoprotein-like n=1 Tax=Mizuhopecten yessoensis TaxID=6573 RepID=UPI000B459538|nr:mesenchyme-specific cell surface glycoprotein-like [Mizuhopecten yessoensis]XP_021368603.1 mesenchyme-specific cell surface glycoprotein-like [Mizuhopecten yessoensis]
MGTFILFLFALSTATATVTLNNVSYMKFASCETGNSDMFSDSAFKASYDPLFSLLYVAGSKCVRIVSVETPASPTVVKTHSFTDGNDGNLVDIAVCGSTVAVLFESAFGLTEGHVYLCERYNSATDQFKCDGFERITVGESPKSMTFTNDCSKLLVANEGRAGLVNGVFTDPDGTVSVIDMALVDTTTPCTTELSTHFFNDQYVNYLQKGVRWTYRGDHNNGIVTLFSQDLEPEQIAISDDGNWAYVTMPENNAMGVINLVNVEWHDLIPFGTKDWQPHGIDTSDADTGAILVTNYDVKGLYQPTAAIFVRTTSTTYVVTANTGVPRTYTEKEQGVNFTDSVMALTALSGNQIDQAAISPDLAYNLATSNHLGRVQMSNSDGRSVISGLISDVHLFGGRDIGFWDINDSSFRYTTGDDLERHGRDSYMNVFNGDCSNASLSPSAEMDSRSTLMGPEPNVLASGVYNSRTLVTAATRNGLVYVYAFNLNTPSFESVHRIGNTTATWGQAQTMSEAGDGLISDMGFITRGSNSYLFVISKATGSLSIKEFVDV